ncbi:MAG: hypothetical protein HW387_653 [Parachlamydiales bacterium]|nr:hypothetical protein [Parachlamydiales bacterium]
MQRDEISLSLKDQFLLSSMGQWMSLHRSLLMNVGTVVLVALAWGVVKIARAPHLDAARHAQEAYAAWKAKPEDESLYQALDQAWTSDLKNAMRADVAQTLMMAGRVDEAEKMAQESLIRLHSISPVHAEFAEISLIIAKKHYQEAVERSVSLKEKLPEHSVLYCQNLCRIAFLQQMLKNPAGEFVAWRELEQFANDENNKTLAEHALKGLADQTVSFTSYIEERKKQL